MEKKMKTQITQSIFRITILTTLFFATASILLAMPADSGISEIYQPDGTSIKIHLRGDEWLNWIETIQGYTIAKSKDGYWRYVSSYDPGQKKSISSPVLFSKSAHENPPVGLEKHIRPAKPSLAPSQEQISDQLSMAPHGTFNGKILFILAEFNQEYIPRQVGHHLLVVQ